MLVLFETAAGYDLFKVSFRKLDAFIRKILSGSVVGSFAYVMIFHFFSFYFDCSFWMRRNYPKVKICFEISKHRNVQVKCKLSKVDSISL